MHDAILLGAVVLSFASWITVHVTLAFGLGRRDFVRGLASFFVPPLAPFFGFRERMWIRSTLWVVCGVGYAVAFTMGNK